MSIDFTTDPPTVVALTECPACDLFDTTYRPINEAEQRAAAHDHEHHQGAVTARTAPF